MIFALIMLVSTMLAAGLQVDRQRLWETLQQYGLLARAALANFVLVPLVALLLVTYFHVDNGIADGVVLMAMAPGVPFLASSAGRTAGGSLEFALTISYCFTALSLITIPLTILLISHVWPAAPVPAIPGTKTLITLVVSQLAPLALGILIRPRIGPATADKIVKILHLIFIAAALVFIGLVFHRIVALVSEVYGLGALAIIAAIAVFSITIGWLLGGPERAYRRTLSIATLMRNIGLCVTIGSAPEFANTLVVPAIVAYTVVTVALSLPLRMLYGRTKGDRQAF